MGNKANHLEPLNDTSVPRADSVKLSADYTTSTSILLSNFWDLRHKTLEQEWNPCLRPISTWSWRIFFASHPTYYDVIIAEKQDASVEHLADRFETGDEQHPMTAPRGRWCVCRATCWKFLFNIEIIPSRWGTWWLIVISTLHLRVVVSTVQPCISMPAVWSKTCLVLRAIQQLSWVGRTSYKGKTLMHYFSNRNRR